MKNTLLPLILVSYCALFAQKKEDLGREKPFMIGLKGAIYNYAVPKTIDPEQWIYRPGIEKTKPIGYVYTQSLDISDRDLDEPFPGVPVGKTVFAILYTGVFEVRDSGVYHFILKSDDGSRLWIDSTEIINNDGRHKFTPKEGKTPLSKGYHNLKVWYFQGLAPRMGLQLMWNSPTDSIPKVFDLKETETELIDLLKPEKTEKGLKVQISDKILFDNGKFDLKPKATAWLSSLARLLNYYPKNHKVRIEGHTDNVGSSASNLTLSEKRANAVLEALKQLGVPQSILFEVKGFGSNQPISPKNTEENRSRNRRVEIFVEPE